jgi:hypothetical protein
MTWLDTTNLLIIAWKSFGHLYEMERIIMKASGEIISGPDSVEGDAVSQDAMLIKDNKERVYAVDFVFGLRIMQVYPTFSEVKSMSLQKYKEFYKKYPAHTFGFIDPVGVITSYDKLLICSRVGWGYTPLRERGIWNSFRPNEVFYVFADLDGNMVSEPIRLNVNNDAFREIPGIHHGGMYYTLRKDININNIKLVAQDMDLSTLPNGNIILSVTAPNKNGKLNVYQMKFAPEGKLITPEKLETVKEKPFFEKSILPVLKCEKAVIWPSAEFRGYRAYLVLFGFDKEGNFYEEREVWKEGEK